MGTVTRAFDFVANTTAVGDQVDADLNTIYAEFNGNIDAANMADLAVTNPKLANGVVTSAKVAAAAILHAALDFTQANSGVIVPKMPTYFGANGSNLVVCETNYTTSTGVTAENVTITFNTASRMGAPNFTTAPIPFGSPIVLSSGTKVDIPTQTWFTTWNNLTATLHIEYGGTTLGVANTKIYSAWIGAA